MRNMKFRINKSLIILIITVICDIAVGMVFLKLGEGIYIAWIFYGVICLLAAAASAAAYILGRINRGTVYIAATILAVILNIPVVMFILFMIFFWILWGFGIRLLPPPQQ